MNEEILRIQKMVAMGKISAEEGAHLLESVFSKQDMPKATEPKNMAAPQPPSMPILYSLVGTLICLGLLAWVSAYFDTETHNLIRSDNQGWRILCLVIGFILTTIGLTISRLLSILGKQN